MSKFEWKNGYYVSDTHIIAIVDATQLDADDLKTLNTMKKGIKAVRTLMSIGCPFKNQIKRKKEGAETEEVIYAFHPFKSS